MRALLLALLTGCGTTSGSSPDDGGDTDPAGAPGDCDATRAWFVDEVWTPALGARCVTCHVDGGAAEATRLVLDPDDPGANLERVWAIAAVVEDGTSRLVGKPSLALAEGHDGGLQAPPGSDVHAALVAMADLVASGDDPCALGGVVGDTDPPEPTCTAIEPGPRRLRRLSRDEYDRTISDLLGIPSTHGAAFAGDVVVEGYANDGDALLVSPLLADQLREAAEAIALQELGSLTSLLPCRPADIGHRDCASAFVVDFGRRAYRRPVTEAEHDGLLALYDLVAGEDGFDQGIRWVIAAMLQSPSFLYRSELGVADHGMFALTAWEVASELSYLVWGTLPDDALLDAAASGALLTEDGLRAHLDRLLADPRAAATMGRFTSAWLGLDRLASASRDAGIYPELTPEIRSAMLGQATRRAGALLAEGGTLDDLLLGQETFLTDELAAYYGVPAGRGPADADGFRRVDLAGTPYRGLLTEGALLTVYASPTHPSPIHRGVLVRERLLCQDLPPPPANLNTSPPTIDPTATGRDKYAQHSADPACSGCHDLIDDVGFGFERYDAIGRFRESDQGFPIDDDGLLRALEGTDVPFSGVDGLAAVLADSDTFRRCFVRQWVRFGHGLRDDAGTTCRVDALDGALREAGGALADVLVALVGDPHFTRRTGGVGEGDALGTVDLAVPLDEQEDGTGPGGGLGGGGLTVRVVVQSDWGSGWCADVHVDNGGADAVTWSVQVQVDATLDNVWNAEATDLGGGRYGFVGASWNAVVEPSATASFGFCATR